MPSAKQKQRACAASYLKLKEHTISKSSLGSDDVYADGLATAGQGEQRSLKCTGSNMSALVWFSHKVIKVASVL